MSVAAGVREHVEAMPTWAFLNARDLPGSRPGVETALSRLVSDGVLIRVRNGLYWKGPQTRVGMPRPRPLAIALQVGGLGAGPAGLSAARTFELTTQVPTIEEVAVPGRVPDPVDGVMFTARSHARRLWALNPTEVALVEVMRTWPQFSEREWPALVTAVRDQVAKSLIRVEQIDAEIEHERSPHAREMWARLEPQLAA